MFEYRQEQTVRFLPPFLCFYCRQADAFHNAQKDFPTFPFGNGFKQDKALKFNPPNNVQVLNPWHRHNLAMNLYRSFNGFVN